MSILDNENELIEQVNKSVGEKYEQMRHIYYNDAYTIITNMSRKIKSSIILNGETRTAESFIQEAREFIEQEKWINNKYYDLEKKKELWYYWGDDIENSIRNKTDEIQKLYQKLLPMISKAKNVIDKTMSRTGLEYECIFSDNITISIKYYNDEYTSIKCTYSKLEKALPSIVKTVCAFKDMMILTGANLISNRQ